MNDSDRSFLDTLKNSIIVKAMAVAILALLLLVPTEQVTDVVAEREELSEETTESVGREWAEEQMVAGPVLSIPYRRGNDTKRLSILPDELRIDGEIEPIELHRGIFDVVVYRSTLVISGTFRPDAAIARLPLGPKDTLDLDEADLYLTVSDLRGIDSEMTLRFDDSLVAMTPGLPPASLFASGVTFDLDEIDTSGGRAIPFRVELGLKGNSDLRCLPLGRTTDVALASTWDRPGFTGAFLPDEREVTPDGFSATWQVLEVNREIPPYWTSGNVPENIAAFTFGVDLKPGVSEYRMSIRAIKYAILVIAVTFLLFFVVEITRRRRLHPFQYLLVGLALALFYLLLVSFSEHLPFAAAYAIASLVVAGMIGLYALAILRSGKLAALATSTLLLVYGLLYVLLSLEAYSLLVGSLGLALLLGAAMFYTRGIDWYGIGRGSEGEAGRAETGDEEVEEQKE